MRLLFAVCLVACQRAPDPTEPIFEPPTFEPAPAVAPKPPAPPTQGKATQIERRDSRTICTRDAKGIERCRSLAVDYFKNRAITSHEATVEKPLKLTRGGVPCTLLGNQLSCGSTSVPVTIEPGGYHVYLRAGETLSWFTPELASTSDPILHPMQPFPGAIAQHAIGFRIGCALTTQAEVYCWSDPEKPRKLAVPANVVDLVLQDPFELCVRTAAGDVHCTPPFAPESLICSKHSIACGTGSPERVELDTSFDPLTKVVRPLRRVALAHSAIEAAADDAPIFQFCLDSLAVGPRTAGACALGDGGKVSCFAACGSSWRIGAVAGLPSTVTKIWSEGTTGYALAADGALYWWPRAHDCRAAANVKATRFELPAILDLAPPLSLQSGPSGFEHVRCALARTGEVRCWKADDTGAPMTPFDPMR